MAELKLEDLVTQEAQDRATRSCIVIMGDTFAPLNPLGEGTKVRGTLWCIPIGGELHLTAFVKTRSSRERSKRRHVSLSSKKGSYWHRRSMRRAVGLIEWINNWAPE